MSRRLATGLCAVALGASAVFACTSFGGSDDSSGSDPNPDGAADVAHVTEADARTPDADASGCSWFCDDFNAGAFPPAGWNLPDLNGGTITATTDAHSAPRAVQAQLVTDSGDGTHSWLRRSKLDDFTTVRCAAWVLVESFGDDLVDFFVFSADLEGSKYDVGVGFDQGGGTVTFGAGGVTQHGLPAPPLNVWTRFAIELKLGAIPTITFDGSSNQANPALFSPADAGAPTFKSGSLALGASRLGGNPSGAWVIDFDDVACDIE